MCYSKEIESEMVKFYNSLSEKDKLNGTGIV